MSSYLGGRPSIFQMVIPSGTCSAYGAVAHQVLAAASATSEATCLQESVCAFLPHVDRLRVSRLDDWDVPLDADQS